MSSTSSDQKRSGGIFVALIPWVLFTLVAQHGTLVLGSVLALAAAVVIAAPGVRAGRPKMIELGAVATFAAFVVVAFAADAHTGHEVARYARAIAAGVLAALALLSLLITPFTEQYARESVPERLWATPRFKDTNRRLTMMWAGVFAAMVPLHLIAANIDTTRGNLLFNWVLPAALVLYGVKRSTMEPAPAQA